MAVDVALAMLQRLQFLNCQDMALVSPEHLQTVSVSSLQSAGSCQPRPGMRPAAAAAGHAAGEDRCLNGLRETYLFYSGIEARTTSLLMVKTDRERLGSVVGSHDSMGHEANEASSVSLCP